MKPTSPPDPTPLEPAAPDAPPSATGSRRDTPAAPLPATRVTPQRLTDTVREKHQVHASLSTPEVEGFTILGELGRGNMGVVYKARQRTLNRLVALKMVRGGAHASEEDIERFLTEARVVARLQHPHIVRIYDVGVQDGLPYFSMEYVEGGNLADKLRGRPMPTRDAARLVRMLARAVHAAHQQGVVHRDLKPANILIRPVLNGQHPAAANPLPSVVPVVTDFGLAKQLEGDGGQTRSGMILGTPNYMSPEQAEGRSRDVGPAADVYSLGAVFYECLTGRPPYNAESPAETVLQIFQAEPVAPSRLQSRVPHDLETICLKCLQKDPRRRYASAEALAADLDRFLAGEPIAARPPSWAERTWSWSRRRPALATLAGCAAATLAGFLALGVWHQFDLHARLELALSEERRARDEEEAAQQAHEAGVLRARVAEMIHAAEGDLANNDWRSAQAHLLRARDLIPDSDPDDLRSSLRVLLETADRLRADHERLQRFVGLRNDALFNATLFTGGDLAFSLGRTKQAAREALALYDVTEETAGPPRSAGPSPDDPRNAEVLGGCYELLLVLADAVAQPLPGTTPADQKLQAAEAVRTLDRADSLGISTRSFHLRRAQYLEQAGDHRAALDETRKAEALAPRSALDHFLLGVEHYRRHEWPAATIDFDKALRWEAGHLWARYYLALCRLKQGKRDLALSELTSCLGDRTDFPWLYLLRGSVCSDMGRLDDAEADFASAADMPLDGAARYGLLINRGVLRVKQSRIDDAVRDLKAAVDLEPKLYQGHVNLAQAYLRGKQYENALRQLDEAVALQPNLPSVYRVRAQARQQAKDLTGALKELDRAVAVAVTAEAAPAELAQTHLDRAVVLLQLDRPADAAEAGQTAVSFDPKLAAAHRVRATALLEIGRHADALKSLNECLDLGPETADLLRARAAVHAHLGHYPAALADYTRVLELAPDAATQTARGWTYVVMDAPKLALADFQKALRTDPTLADALSGRGYARVQTGDLGGISDVEQALKLGPATTRLTYNSARTYAQAAARSQDARARYERRAVELLTKSLDLTPSSQRAAFWKDVVQTDPALKVLRQNDDFRDLALR